MLKLKINSDITVKSNIATPIVSSRPKFLINKKTLPKNNGLLPTLESQPSLRVQKNIPKKSKNNIVVELPHDSKSYLVPELPTITLESSIATRKASKSHSLPETITNEGLEKNFDWFIMRIIYNALRLVKAFLFGKKEKKCWKKLKKF
jgi:hypothetical protein